VLFAKVKRKGCGQGSLEKDMNSDGSKAKGRRCARLGKTEIDKRGGEGGKNKGVKGGREGGMRDGRECILSSLPVLNRYKGLHLQ
jgi:hypothetical protein